MVDGYFVVSGEIFGMGIQELKLYYEVDGDDLTGTVWLKGEEIEVIEGKVDGNTFTHKCKVNAPVGRIKVSVSGEVNDDDITFMLKTPVLTSKFVGKRVDAPE